MNRARRWAGLAGLMALLAACTTPRIRPDAGLLNAQDQRERSLLKQADWSLEGRLAISGPSDSGSGSLDWLQQGERFRFTVSAPVSGKTWTLRGDATHAELTGLGNRTPSARDASGLLEQELGWKVPVAELAYWVRGMRAPGQAEMRFRDDGLPAEFQQAGWTIEYRDYAQGHDPVLPRRIFASNGDYKVRLVVQQWEMR